MSLSEAPTTRIDPLARLTCGHYRRVTVHQAQTYDYVQCPRCQRFEQPETVFIREWFVWCSTSGCDWSRWVGQVKRYADAAKHQHHKRGRYAHCVRMDYAIVPGFEYAEAIANGAPAVAPTLTLEASHDPVEPDLFSC